MLQSVFRAFCEGLLNTKSLEALDGSTAVEDEVAFAIRNTVRKQTQWISLSVGAEAFPNGKERI
jgi:hypothetical protein